MATNARILPAALRRHVSVVLAGLFVLALASAAPAQTWTNQDEWSIKAGGSYSKIHTLSRMDLKSRADFLGGVNNSGADKIIVTEWAMRDPQDLWLGAEMLRITGLTGDKAVLQFKYDDAPLGNMEKYWASTGELTIYTGGTGHWRGVAGDLYQQGKCEITTSDPLWNYQGSWKQAGCPLLLGAHGCDYANNTVWAVINSDGIFAPEPATLTLLLAGGCLVLMRRRRR